MRSDTQRRLWLLSVAAGFGGNGRQVPCYRASVCGNTALTLRTVHADRNGKTVRPACALCVDISGTQLRQDIKRLGATCWRCSGCDSWKLQEKKPRGHRVPHIGAEPDEAGLVPVETVLCGEYVEHLIIPRRVIP